MRVLILSHGSLAKGLYEACSMIVGKMDFLSYLGLENQGLEDFDQKIKLYLNKNKDKKICFLFDLKYGTPYNQVLIQLLNYKNIQYQIVTGVNLPILLTLCMQLLCNENADVDLKKIVKNSKNSIEISESAIERNNND